MEIFDGETGVLTKKTHIAAKLKWKLYYITCWILNETTNDEIKKRSQQKQTKKRWYKTFLLVYI